MDFNELAEVVSIYDIGAVIITAIPLTVGFAMLLLGALLPQPEQKSTVMGMGLIVTTISFFPHLCTIVFGAKGLLVILLLAVSVHMVYVSLGKEGNITFTLNRLKLSFEKLPPAEEDEPEPEGGGKMLKFERRVRSDTRPRPL